MASHGLPVRELRTITGHKGAVYAVRFNNNGTYCMSCGQDSTLRLWNPHRDDPTAGTGALLLKKYSGPHGHGVLDVCISPDNSQFASCGKDKTVPVWDVATGKVVRKFWNHDLNVNAVAFAPAGEGAVLLTGSHDQKVRVWDLRSRNFEPIQVMRGFDDSVTSLLATGHEIIAASVDGAVRTFDLRRVRRAAPRPVAAIPPGVHSPFPRALAAPALLPSSPLSARNDSILCRGGRAGRSARQASVHVDLISEPVTSISLSRDQNCLLASCLDNTIRLLEQASGELLNQYTQHKNASFKIDSCLTHTDAHVVSGSEDATIYFWDLVEGTLVHQLKGHAKTVCSISHHPSEALIVSASYDGTVKVWGR